MRPVTRAPRWDPLACAALLALALGACDNSARCQDSCTHASQVCEQEFKDKGITWDVPKCTDECVADFDRCDKQDQTVDCILAAKTCGEIGECPACTPTVPDGGG